MNDEELKAIEASVPEGMAIESITRYGGTDERVQITLAPVTIGTNAAGEEEQRVVPLEVAVDEAAAADDE